jgi:DNA-binding GntR family transcriptional regulator
MEYAEKLYFQGLPMRNRSEALRDFIEEKIAIGELRPGQSLDETELAKQFGVSRTPVREALIQLASMGLVVTRPRRPTTVAEIPPQHLVEMFEVMAELEAMCGRLAARRMSKEEQKELLNAHQACLTARDAQDADDYYFRNERFHELIYMGSHNSFLVEQAKNLHRRLRPYRRLQLRVRDRLENSYSEHEGVVSAILSGDGEKAAQSLRDHVMVQGQRFADLIASLSQFNAHAA